MNYNDMEENLKDEYNETFDGEDKLSHSLMHIKSKITVRPAVLDIDSIIVSNFKKVGRENTVIGLAGVVGEWGVVSPIHVIALEDDDCYLLADGLRRVFAAIRNGLKTIPAMIWDFSDKQEGKDCANIISLMVNRSQRFTPKEMWEQMKLLEEVNGASPGLIEFLLQMESGDSMKLKDIMLADMDYAEIQASLMDGELTIDAAYKKLCNLRKKENKLAKDDMIVIEESPQNEIDDNPRLGVDEVKDLLELSGEDVGDMSLEDMDRTEEVRKNDMYQTTDERHPVPKEIKEGTLIRDKFKCRCCGQGGIQWLGVLVYHHLIPVFCGGPDTIENGLTLCVNCHLTLHLYIFGKVQVDLTKLDKDEEKVFRNIFKYGNIAIEAQKRKGMKKEDAYKADAGSRRHLFPGEGLKDNIASYNKANNE